MKKRTDIGGARRLNIDVNSVCPTIMAGGVGSVNTSQYQLVNNMNIQNKNKPPYKIPTMQEIRNIKHNGFNTRR